MPKNGDIDPKTGRVYRGVPGGGGHPTTADIDYTDDEREFIRAMDEFHKLLKAKGRKPFPTLTEILAVVRSLGYSKMEPLSFPWPPDDDE